MWLVESICVRDVTAVFHFPQSLLRDLRRRMRQTHVRYDGTRPRDKKQSPFTQRVLLTLEEKKIPYQMHFIDITNKPQWFLEANPEGKVPAVKLDGKWVPDKLLRKNTLNHLLLLPLKLPQCKYAIKDAADSSEQALISSLYALDEHLKAHGPFVNGEKVSAVDLSLARRLFHLEVALGHYKSWSIPENLGHVKNYMLLFSRESFVKTVTSDKKYVIAGWEHKVNP
ncbi:hypothetical protein MKX01_027413 [Papaver californicum]|nr:hypothetical protein MKX01_027413 [Papaver californicum]